ncbi:hypothetical protein U6B65_12190 [Oscillospiraceae bacterium MB08-C2-2]|nr:hypothetical protein U6B65_12190 [Oscillospiraceae bacterium MB08-C2-2]
MGVWYLLALFTGVVLYIKFTFFSKRLDWKTMLSIQLPLIGLALVAFALFMFSPASIRLIDILFS